MAKKSVKKAKNLKPARKVKGGVGATAIKWDKTASKGAKLIKSKVGFERVTF